MRSFAKKLLQKGNFLGGFYFWRSDSARNNLEAFFPTLAVQLAKYDPSTRPFIERALQEDDLLLGSSYATQMEKLLITPLIAAHHDHPDRPHPRFIVIDGLDECDLEGQHEFLEKLLPTLTSHLSKLSIALFISSRPESIIQNGFSHPRLSAFVNRTCLEPSRKDVRQFLNDEFEEINRCYSGLKSEDGGRWPNGSDLDILEDKSSGYFVLVATAVRHIKPSGSSRGRTPDERLREVLEALRPDVFAPLDALYLYILGQNAPEDPIKLAEWKETIGLICIPVLPSISVWKHVFGHEAFRILYGRSRTEVEQIVRDLGSIFYVDKDGQPHNYHASFPDCLFNPERSAQFAVDPQLLHERIACLIIQSLNSVHISDVEGMPSSFLTLVADSDHCD